jgi:sugar fermentation stimulation protein A
MTDGTIFMAFPQPQLEAVFLRRPQRFLAEMSFPNGNEELVYCANSGAMTGCLNPGMAAILWDSSDPTRKRRYTWRAVKFEGGWIGTDTHLANRIVEEALKLKLVPSLESYCTLAREQLLEVGFRVDFVLTGHQGECIVEVKSATVVKDGVARFPDSATPRGVKHLKALRRHALAGKRSILLFLIQRADAHSFVVSNSHDPAYADAFDEAVAAGVEIVALSVAVSPAGFCIPKVIPYAEGSMMSVDTNH